MLRLFVKPTMALTTATVIAATGRTELFYSDAPGWAAVDSDCADFMLASYYDENTDDVDSTWTYYKLRVPKGYYHSVQQVGEIIPKQLAEACGMYNAHLDMEMDYATGYAKFIPRSCKVIMFHTSKYLMELLGTPCAKHTERNFTSYKREYGKWTTYQVSKSLQRTKKPHLDVMHSMYVYSDLIEAQPVGDVEAPLLG
jgi:hypothetical protein